MTPCIALLRGINVGRAKRIAMADLRALLEGLGFSGVRTVLNSGNAVFCAPPADVDRIAQDIETAIARQLGLRVPVIVLTAAALDEIVAARPPDHASGDPSKCLVAFVPGAAALATAATLCDTSWAPDRYAVGRRAAYLCCADSLLTSPLAQAFTRAMGAAVTTRNWATVCKLQAAAKALPAAR